MTNDERRPDAASELPAPVTGVARGGQGTGTALDDTQVYDVAELTAGPSEHAASASQPAPAAIVEQPAPRTPAQESVAPEAAAPVVGPVVAPVPQANPRVTRRRASNDGRSRVGAPVAGLVGFAIAAVLAILVGASLGGMTDRGTANDDATFAPATEAPAETEAGDGDEGDEGEGGNGKGNKGCKGNGNGNCDDD